MGEVRRSPRESTNTLHLASTVLSFGLPASGRSVSGWRVAVPALDVAIPEIPQPQPLNPQGEAWQMNLSPVKSRKAKEQNDGTPVKKWLLRVAPWFLPVGIVRCGNWPPQLAGCRRVFCPHRRGSDGVLDALRQRRIVAASAISSWRALIGFSIGGSLGLIWD